MDYPYAVVKKPKGISPVSIITALSEIIDQYAEGNIDILTVNVNTVAIHTKILMDTRAEQMKDYTMVFHKINVVRELFNLSPLPVFDVPISNPIEHRILNGGDENEEILAGS